MPQREPVDVAKHGDFEWDFDVHILPHARGLDDEPVFTQSPRVHLIAEGEWRIDLTYAPLGGEQEEISEQTFDAGIAEPFPSDLYEDPWVGRYKVSLWRDEELVDVRFISLAEGLHMRAANDGPRGMDFRIIDALGAHSAFSYTLASPPKKPIALEKGLRTFEDTEVSRREVVASEAGYELEFDVWPEALFSRVKRIGLEPTEHSDKPVIFAGQLDQDDMFTVHSPRPLPLAKFVTIDGRQKIKELARTSRTTQSVTSLAVPNAALANAVRKQPSAELFLMWSTLSYEDYLDSLPAGARGSPGPQLGRRIVEYEASASTSLIYAALATVRKSPFVSRGLLNGDEIIIEQNAEPQADLVGWAWPLAEPTVAPTQLTPTEEGFELPAELAEQGSLLVDVRELRASSNLAAPARPSSASIVITPEGSPAALASRTGPRSSSGTPSARFTCSRSAARTQSCKRCSTARLTACAPNRRQRCRLWRAPASASTSRPARLRARACSTRRWRPPPNPAPIATWISSSSLPPARTPSSPPCASPALMD